MGPLRRSSAWVEGEVRRTELGSLSVRHEVNGSSVPSAKLRALLSGKVEHAMRLTLVNWLNGLVPLYLVTEYPKSGGTWLGQMLAAVLGVPFPRNRIPLPRRALFHGHYLPTNRFRRLRGIFWQVRDGRDVMVSLYHHLLLPNDKNVLHVKDLHYYRQQVPFQSFDDVRENLPAFIEFIFTHRLSRRRQFTTWGTWSSFNQRWMEYADSQRGDRLAMIRYEDLLHDAADVLGRVLAAVGGAEPDATRVQEAVARYSFEAQSGRRRGQEAAGSFLRRGVAGDWKNYFSRAAAEVFAHYAGDTLTMLGYERDAAWVERVAR